MKLTQLIQITTVLCMVVCLFSCASTKQRKGTNVTHENEIDSASVYNAWKEKIAIADSIHQDSIKNATQDSIRLAQQGVGQSANDSISIAQPDSLIITNTGTSTQTWRPYVWTPKRNLDSTTHLKPNRKAIAWHMKNGSAKNLDILQELKTRFANRDTNAIADRIAVIRYLIAAPGRGDIASKRYCHEYLTALWEVNYHRIRVAGDKSAIVRYLNGDKKAISQTVKLMVIYAWLFDKIEYYNPEHAVMYDYATQEMITDLKSENKLEDVEFVLRTLLTFTEKGF